MRQAGRKGRRDGNCGMRQIRRKLWNERRPQRNRGSTQNANLERKIQVQRQ